MNKQIEEMARDIQLNMSIKPNPKETPAHQLARLMYEDGYRKSTDVAREIFEEIEGLMWDAVIGGKYPAKVINPDKFADLKKKYESEGVE